MRGTLFVRNGAVTPRPSRECDITFFVKGRPKSAQQWRDSAVAARRAQSVTTPSSRVSRVCYSPLSRFGGGLQLKSAVTMFACLLGGRRPRNKTPLSQPRPVITFPIKAEGSAEVLAKLKACHSQKTLVRLERANRSGKRKVLVFFGV